VGDTEPLERGYRRRILSVATLSAGMVGLVVGIVAPVGLLILLVAASFLPACDPPLPTDDTGEGRTDELNEALDHHSLRMPADASEISYRLHSSFDSVEIGVRFQTTTDGLSEFLDSDELAGVDLVAERNPWDSTPAVSPARPPEAYGWDFTSISSYAGLAVDSYSDQSWLGVLVDFDRPGRPVVYAYSLGCC
jgi:hypothetical protein